MFNLAFLWIKVYQPNRLPSFYVVETSWSLVQSEVLNIVKIFKVFEALRISKRIILIRLVIGNVVFTFLSMFHRPVSQFILPPGQLAPRGTSQPRLACPPGGKLSRDILPPTLVIFTPGGQAVQAGLSCPPPNTSKNIYMLFCYFSVSF